MHLNPIRTKNGEERPAPARAQEKGLNFSRELEARTKKTCTSADDQGGSPEGPSLVCLGTISEEDRTVSELLVQSAEYGRKTWPIVHSEQNRLKPYTKIQPGTKVYLNPETLEVSWSEKIGPPGAPDREDRPVLSENSGKTRAVGPPSIPLEEPSERDLFSEELVEAVKPCLGSPYKKLNCYELVVHGLEKLGVKYQGKGGLAEQLIKTAVSRGLKSNAYLNGEGLVATSGSLVYSHSFSKIRDPKGQALQIYKDMEPLLHKGLILSFSTPTRGHTGVISSEEDSWTYINSGFMDHPVQERRMIKGVGEEVLVKELENWLELASNRKEPLQISLGRLSKEKLRGFNV